MLTRSDTRLRQRRAAGADDRLGNEEADDPGHDQRDGDDDDPAAQLLEVLDQAHRRLVSGTRARGPWRRHARAAPHGARRVAGTLSAWESRPPDARRRRVEMARRAPTPRARSTPCGTRESPCPTAFPMSGSLPGPKMIRTITSRMMSSIGPGIGISLASSATGMRAATGRECSTASGIPPPAPGRLPRRLAPVRAAAMRRRCPADVHQARCPGPVAGPHRGRQVAALGAHAGHQECRLRHRGRGRSPAQPDAVAPTTSPTRPSRQRPRHPAGDVHVQRLAIDLGASGAARRPGCWSGPARRPSDRGTPGTGSMASSPRYGDSVTASASRRPNRAVAWRSAVEPMSPRLASRMQSASAGTSRRTRSSAAHPGAPRPRSRRR